MRVAFPLKSPAFEVAPLLIALLLAVVNVGLMRVAVALFDRESILTRWK